MSETSSIDLFRTVHHVCVIVDDLDAAVSYYESIGVGPWNDFPPMETIEDSNLSREDLLSLSYRWCELDNMHLQLCHPGPGDTGQRKFLETRGPGVYHLGFTVPDVDEAEQAGVEHGLSVRAYGRLENRHGFTYFETEKPAGVVLEVRSSWT